MDKFEVTSLMHMAEEQIDSVIQKNITAALVDHKHKLEKILSRGKWTGDFGFFYLGTGFTFNDARFFRDVVCHFYGVESGEIIERYTMGETYIFGCLPIPELTYVIQFSESLHRIQPTASAELVQE